MKYPFFILSFLFFLLAKAGAQIPEITENTNTVMGMVLLEKMELMDYTNIEAAILDTWGVEKETIDGNDQTISFVVEGVTFLIGMIPAPVPGNDLITAVEYSYLWKDARKALNNQSHIMVAVVGETSSLNLYKSFTTITAILLEYTNSTGVYLSKQSLVVSKAFFLSEAITMDEDYLPLYLWIYFGRRANDRGTAAYTYGLKEFGLEEMEIVNSTHSLEEVVDFLYHTTKSVITGNIQLSEGQNIGQSEKEKIFVTFSNGENLGEDSWKLAY